MILDRIAFLLHATCGIRSCITTNCNDEDHFWKKQTPHCAALNKQYTALRSVT